MCSTLAIPLQINCKVSDLFPVHHEAQTVGKQAVGIVLNAFLLIVLNCRRFYRLSTGNWTGSLQ